VTKDCLSCVYARCGFIINTLRKKTFSTGAVRTHDEYCAPAESLLISSLTGFLLPEM